MVLDTIYKMKEASSKVTPKTVKNCFRKAGFTETGSYEDYEAVKKVEKMFKNKMTVEGMSKNRRKYANFSHSQPLWK